jgi:hypothetical protein
MGGDYKGEQYQGELRWRCIAPTRFRAEPEGNTDAHENDEAGNPHVLVIP